MAAGLVVTSPLVAHAETSTECAAGTDTASINRLISNQLADLRRVRHNQGDRSARWAKCVDGARRVSCSCTRRPPLVADIVYGAAVESDASFSYLFGWSYDQFNLPDPTSPRPSQMFVARVPIGRFDQQPTYWNGVDRVATRAAAVASSTTPHGASNPMQPRLIDGMWVSVVKDGEWNGNVVRVDVATAPQGPWTTVQSVAVPTRTLGFVPATPPIRAIDTRESVPLRSGHVLRVALAGIVPADARTAVIDLAAVEPAGPGFLTAWSCDEAMPPTSNLNYLAGATRATHAAVTLAADASICMYSMTTTTCSST